MRARTLILLVILILVIAFAVVNWKAIAAPTALSLVVTEIQAPLGVILLGISALLTISFLLYLAYLQTSVLLDARRHTRQLQEQRELADRAEASRFTELRTFVETEMRHLSEQCAALESSLDARLDQLQRELGGSIAQTENSLAAYIGELEDRVQRNERNSMG